jgi:hypothetical protein
MSYQKALTKNKKLILWGSVIFVLAYFMVRLVTTSTLEIGYYDWGMDMGYTQLLWGFVLVIVCLSMLFYFKQKQIRFPLLNKAMIVILSTPIIFIFIGFFFYQFMAHDPSIDLYHRLNFFESNLDKIMHFLFALFLTIIVLKTSPNRSTLLLVLIFVWLFTLAYEVAEIQFIYWFSDKPYEDWLIPEIADGIPDILVNSMGVVIGFLLMKNKIRMNA